MVALLIGSASVSSTGLVAETRVAPGQHDAAVARTVGGMISYTRWPAERAVLHICVSGATVHAAGLGRIDDMLGRQVEARRIPPGNAAQDCDVLYLGTMGTADRQRVMRSIRDRPVLSIAEADPDCRGGAIFCLQVLPDRIGFRLSIDAVSRSAVRIDPRVLRIALPEGGAR
ncbi:YfiR family protein [Sphingomonas sp. BT-65]|uniref:YfiR family protein n=1 Tax=Sphingomonas sp. BT-65 TaxID=2989821 RepID=UPI0022369C90|nr:YfiR family protein [Sphingomonas sp. BT-65]MCW4463153.1 YfiR family protein [Sphingomonas sp. BT-65]